MKQFRTEGCLAYFVVDPTAGVAVAVDPRVQAMGEYQDWLASRRLKVAAVLETQLHADHLSASHLFRQQFGADIVMSARTSSDRATRRLEGGETLRWSGIEVNALATPGRTLDAMSFRTTQGVFTGDSLWIGALAAPEGQGASLEQSLSSQREILFALPDETLVFPGHDASDILFSRIGIEKRASERELLGNAWVTPPDDEIRARLNYNLQASPPTLTDHRFGGGPISVSRGLAVTTPQKAAIRLREADAKLIDVREPTEFERGHASGALNWPLSEFSNFLALIGPSDRLYVCCEVGRRSVSAVRTLDWLGVGHATLVQGGYLGWKQAGLP